jgi:hypothetical protein
MFWRGGSGWPLMARVGVQRVSKSVSKKRRRASVSTPRVPPRVGVFDDLKVVRGEVVNLEKGGVRGGLPPEPRK